MKVIYEVNLSVSADVLDEYVPWLQQHVEEMLAIDGFESAQLLKICEPPESDDRVGFTVQSQLEGRGAMENYLTDHAERMRQTGVDRFGQYVTATRRIFVEGLTRATTDEICPLKDNEAGASAAQHDD